MIQPIDQYQRHFSLQDAESHVFWPLAISLEHTTQRWIFTRFHHAFNLRHMAAILTLFLLALPAEAGPLNWLRHHPKTSKLIVAGVAAGVHFRGLQRCRQTGVEKCDGQYGAAYGIWGAVTAANFVMIPVSEKLGGWQGNVISYGGSAAQLGHGIIEWQKGGNDAKTKSDSFASLLRH
jgi:hypothetical protein